MAIQKSNNMWAYTKDITVDGPFAARTTTKVLKTKDTFVDADIKITINENGVAEGKLKDVNGNAPVTKVTLNDETYLTTNSNGNYGPIVATADAASTSKDGVEAVKTSGWIRNNATLSVSTPAGVQSTITKYVKAGKLEATIEGNAPIAAVGLTDTTYLTESRTKFGPVTATADARATSKQNVDTMVTAGWIPANGSVTVTTPAAKRVTVDKYIKEGAFKEPVGGEVVAIPGFTKESETYITSKKTRYPIEATADALRTAVTVGIQTPGWFPETDFQTSEGENARQSTLKMYVKEGIISGSTGDLSTTVSTSDTTYTTENKTNYPVKIKSDATVKASSVGIVQAGWVDVDSRANVSANSKVSEKTIYIKEGALKNVTGGTVTATAGFNTSNYLTTNKTQFPIVATANAKAANSATAVATAGWIPTTASSTVEGKTANQATATTYIKEGSISNVATAGVRYTEVGQNDSMALIADDYLYINEGYQTAKKISLQNLIPGEASLAIGGNAWLYLNKTATTADGSLITGTMPKAQLETSSKITGVEVGEEENGQYKINVDIDSKAGVVTSGLAVNELDNSFGGTYADVGVTFASSSATSTAKIDAIELSTSGSISEISFSKKDDDTYKINVAAGSTETNVSKEGYGRSESATGTISSSATVAATKYSSQSRVDNYAEEHVTTVALNNDFEEIGGFLNSNYGLDKYVEITSELDHAYGHYNYSVDITKGYTDGDTYKAGTDYAIGVKGTPTTKYIKIYDGELIV